MRKELKDAKSEADVKKALKAYPFKEVLSGLFWMLFVGADRHYFEICNWAILVGVVFLFQTNSDAPWPYLGLTLIVLGIGLHIYLIANVRIRKIKEITTVNNYPTTMRN